MFFWIVSCWKNPENRMAASGTGGNQLEVNPAVFRLRQRLQGVFGGHDESHREAGFAGDRNRRGHGNFFGLRCLDRSGHLDFLSRDIIAKNISRQNIETFFNG